jgi:hypothetical protein
MRSFWLALISALISLSLATSSFANVPCPNPSGAGCSCSKGTTVKPGVFSSNCSMSASFAWTVDQKKNFAKNLNPKSPLPLATYTASDADTAWKTCERECRKNSQLNYVDLGELKILWNKLKDGCDLHSAGLFRLSPSKETLDECLKGDLKTCLARDCKLQDNINLFAGMFKGYLQRHNPIFSDAVYNECIAIGNIPDYVNAQGKVSALLHKLKTLDSKSYDAVAFLFTEMFPYVLKFKDDTKMDPKNIAIVFGPNLVRARDPRDEAKDVAQNQHFFAHMLQYFSKDAAAFEAKHK